ncbi:DUF4430 domain-containing protein [Paenibacillus whitsoniae]|uniref:DUF4430 domain-containing protein n=1 Tax=Paenibacillus whitsoniae TaxID=2496558 RepID=A0A3S0CYN3_9BACL|nr:DUF4430 domain-containing protein [Paenibacillus whitsoniae]RTE11798.1 DUF4430 domain-containing protein [Paenibacillus whitsoniae]
MKQHGWFRSYIAFIMSFVVLVSSVGLTAGLSPQHASAATGTGPSSIREWLPAPGQFINESGWGGTGDINTKWTNTPGSAGVSVGAFGGGLTFKFDEPIENNPLNPYGVDFTVFGNAFSGNEEPGGVAVAQDDGTGNPGPWYYIAGSEHYEDSTIWDYRVTYTNPEPDFTSPNGVNIPWTDNQGGSGLVKTNGSHKHAYYPIPANYPNVPADFNNLSYTYSGVKIAVRKNAFGYPDTHANGSAPYDVPANPYLTSPTKGDPIDISWAVDSAGKPVQLTNVSFVRVYNAVQIDGGAFGEIGPEVTSIVRVTPDASVGTTADLSSIVLTGTGTDSTVSKTVTVTSGVYTYENIKINADKIKLTANGTATTVFVNNTSGTVGTPVNKEITLSETTPKLVRVIAQDGLNAPKIYYLSILKAPTLPVSVAVSGYSANAGKSVVLASKGTKIEVGQTAKQAIENVLIYNNIPFVNPSGNYITGIGGLSAADGGSKAGWMYLVNGQFAMVGIAEYVLQSNDTISLVYTDDYEQDITLAANKTQLIAKIAEVEALQASSYTDVSWQTLQASLTLAKAVASNAGAIQYHADTALAKLTTAQQGLVEQQTITATLTVDGHSTAAGKDVTLAKKSVSTAKGKTATDVVQKVLTDESIPFDDNGGAYISSVGNLAAFDGGPNSGWMYLVNNQMPDVGMADYVLQNNDAITLIYVDDYMEQANKTQLNAKISVVEALQAGSYTDSSWQALQASLTGAKAVAAYAYAVQYQVDVALADLTAAQQGLVLKPAPPQLITVSFTLNGNSVAAGKNVSLATKTVSVPVGSTAAYVIEKVLNENSISFVNESGNYISSVGGLAEFNGGPNSGWLYSVNGSDPNVGIADYVLNANASIILRYTDDYTKEGKPSGSGVTGGGVGSSSKVVDIPSSQKEPYTVDLAKEIQGQSELKINIPSDVQSKVILNTEGTQANLPAITATKGDVTVSVDKGTALKSGDRKIELLTTLSSGDAELQRLVSSGLATGSKLDKVFVAFAMGNEGGSVLFDKPLTLTVKGGKNQLAGYLEGGTFTPIRIYDSEAQGVSATSGQEKITFAYVSGNDLIIKTNHFTSFVTYAVSKEAAPQPTGLGALYGDANLISDWAVEAIREASQKAFVDGSEGKFHPGVTVTRAEFTKMLSGVLGLKAKSDAALPFSDVTSRDWFYPYVKAAYQAGFVSGTSDDTFSPQEKLTREQMAVILAKALGLKVVQQKLDVQDADLVSDWSQASVGAVLSQGLMSGWDQRFHPQDEVTREMAVVVAMRAYYQPKPSQPDVSQKAAVDKQINQTSAYLQQTVTDPTVGTLGGEWTVLGLLRSGVPVPDAYYAKYYANLAQILKDKAGKLHAVKYTEYDRVILALAALGRDPRQTAGYDLLTWLADYETLIKQGINGPIFALLALDSKGYDIPAVASVKTQTTRDLLLDFILKRELTGGGWALAEGSTEADADITAMAIQGLTPYIGSKPNVQAAVDRGVAWLSKSQGADGSFASGGASNSESISQVVIALSGLGVDAHTDARFVKNGRSALDALLGYASQDGGFYHVLAGGEANGGAKPGDVDPMATDQGLLALDAYARLLGGKNRLYDMHDVK